VNHADVKSCLADYLEGDLSLDKRALVDAHLDACADCAGEVDQMRRMIRLLRLLPEPETPPMIAAHVMRRIRAGESRPGLVTRFMHTLGGILDPGFVLPAAVIATAAMVLVVWQDPASIRASLGSGGLGPRLEASLETTGVGPTDMDASRGGSGPRGTGLESERGRVFGAPAARDFRTRTVAKDSDPRSSMQGQTDPTPRVAPMQTRIVIQLEPLASRGPVFHQDPLLAPLGSSPFGMLETSFGGGMAQGATGWRQVGRQAPEALEARFSSTRSESTSSADSSTGAPSGSTGVDKRDEWIARAIEDPRGFARFIASQNLAEQELWVARLSERAQARGLLEDLVTRMRNSGEATAIVLAEDFAAAAAGSNGEAARAPASR
jgi:hypothetical protein